MNILNILNNKELSDIPILYILRIINAIQKESINGRIVIKRWQMMNEACWISA